MTDMEMKDKDTIKKRDIVLAAVLLILGITGVLIVKYGLKSGNTADVYIDDKLVQTIDMSVDDEYTFQTDKGLSLIHI